MKKIKFENDNLIVTHTLKKEHVLTLFFIKANDGYTAFENRDPNLKEDLDGNELSWKLCDELVEMGLLKEDDEAHDVFELTPDGEELISQISSQKQ